MSQTWRMLDDLDDEEPDSATADLTYAEEPHYPSDPGSGVRFYRRGDKVLIGATWDGAERFLVEVSADDLRRLLV